MMDDLIKRQEAIECLEHLSACDEPFVEIGTDDETFIGKYEAITKLSDLPPAQPERIQNNAVHLCDSCQYTYVTCPSHGNDAVFGGGKGNDNICACNKYRPISAQPEIIRCKECKFYRCDGCFFSTAETEENGFCSWAERRTDG